MAEARQLLEQAAAKKRLMGGKSAAAALRAGLPGGDAFRRAMNQLESCEAQVEALNQWFGSLAEQHERLPYLPSAAAAANDDNDALEEATTRRLLA